MAHHVDPSLRDEDGYTAADLAEYHGHQHCARFLRDSALTVGLVPSLATLPPPRGQDHSRAVPAVCEG